MAARQPAAAGNRGGSGGGRGGSRQPSPAPENGTSSSSSSSSTDDGILQLALTQLIHERPDVAQHASKQLRERVRSLPLGVALTAIGSLMELSKDWKTGVRDPQAELQRVVARAAAAAAAEGAGAAGDDDDDGWVELGAGGSSSSSSTANGRKAGGNASLAAAWSGLERRRSDVTQHLSPGHRAIISKLSAAQQIEMLAMLEELPQGMLARARDPESALLGLVDKFATVISRPMNEELKAALEDLQQRVPKEVAERLDGGVYSRIAAMPLDRAMVAVQVLKDANYQPGWHERVTNPQAWLMGVITRGLARHFGEA